MKYSKQEQWDELLTDPELLTGPTGTLVRDYVMPLITIIQRPLARNLLHFDLLHDFYHFNLHSFYQTLILAFVKK